MDTVFLLLFTWSWGKRRRRKLPAAEERGERCPEDEGEG
jgi:hypothetical protein